MHISGPRVSRRRGAAVVAALVTCSTVLTGQHLAVADLWQGRTPEPPPPLPAPPVPNPNPYAGEEQGAAVFCADSPNPRDPEAYHSF